MWTILPTANRGNTELLMTERTAIFNRDYHNITSQKYKSGNRPRRPVCNDCNDRYDAKQNSGYSANASEQKKKISSHFSPFFLWSSAFFRHIIVFLPCAFQLQQRYLSANPTSISRQAAICPHYTMARHNNRNFILSYGPSHCLC